MNWLYRSVPGQVVYQALGERHLTLIDSMRMHRTCMQSASLLRSAITPMPSRRLTLRVADHEQAH